MLMDAQSYADATGVELAEAVTRLFNQEAIGELGDAIESNETETFGGLWIQHEPYYAVVIAFTRDGAATACPYVQGTTLADLVEIRKVDFTLQELKAARTEAHSMIESLGLDSGESGIDVKNNRAEIYLTQEHLEAAESALKDAGLKLPDGVTLVTVSGYARPA